MIREINQAQFSIYIEMYIFLDDTSASYNFFGALKEKASNGVEVILVLDSFGSSELKSSIIKDLRENGVEVLFFSHWLRRTHRKILLIDNKIIFLGGVNIKKNSINWSDLQIKIVSPLLAKNILRSFSYTYKMSGGKKEKILLYRKKSIFKTIRAQFLEHFPNNNIYTLETYYQEKIISAQKSIIIITPYFTPARWLLALLDGAQKRGVEIDIFIPKDTDVKILNRINRAFVNKLIYSNINFYTQNEMNHAKVLLIDEKEVLIGSQNLDFLSFRLNIESGVFIRDTKIIEEIKKIIQTWKKDSVKFTKNNIEVSFFDKLFLGVIRFFYTIL